MKITDYSIALHNVHLYAYHGVLEQERSVGAWFTINIRLFLDDCSCAYSDCIDETVSYADVYDVVVKEMEKPSLLLENVCKRILEVLFDRFGGVSAVEIDMKKDTPPMGGDRLSSAVTLRAER